MESKERFDVKYLDEAWSFLISLDEKARRKILTDIDVAKRCGNVRFFKKLKGTEIWEFKTRFASIQYRLLAFWDNRSQSFLIATHGFIKKTQKTPAKEIEKAEILRKEYFNDNNI